MTALPVFQDAPQLLIGSAASPCRNEEHPEYILNHCSFTQSSLDSSKSQYRLIDGRFALQIPAGGEPHRQVPPQHAAVMKHSRSVRLGTIPGARRPLESS